MKSQRGWVYVASGLGLLGCVGGGAARSVEAITVDGRTLALGLGDPESQPTQLGAVRVDTSPRGYRVAYKLLSSPNPFVDRVGFEGQSLDPTPFALAMYPGTSIPALGSFADRDVAVYWERQQAFFRALPPSDAAPPLPVSALPMEVYNESLLSRGIRCGPTHCVLVRQLQLGSAPSLRIFDAGGRPTGSAASENLLMAVTVGPRFATALFNLSNPDTGRPDIALRRLAFDGTWLDAAPRRFSTVGGARESGDLATDGTAVVVSYRVTLASGSTPAGQYVQRVDVADGIVPSGPASLVSLSPSPGGGPSCGVIWDGARYFVCWAPQGLGANSDPCDVIRVGADGRPLDAAPRHHVLLAGRLFDWPQVAGGYGHRALVVRDSETAAYRLMPLGDDGSPALASAVPVSATLLQAASPALGTDGASLMGGCNTDRSYATSVRHFTHPIPDLRATGTVAGRPTAIEIPGRLHWTGTDYVGVTEAGLVHVSTAGEARVAAITPAQESRPVAMVLLGGRAFINRLDGRLLRTDLEGRALDPAPIVVTAYQGPIATNGTVVVRAWVNGNTVRAVRLDAGGAVLDAEPWSSGPLPVGGGTGDTDMDAAFGGGVWTFTGRGTVVQFSAAGTFLRTVRLGGERGHTRVVWNGSEFVFVTDQRSNQDRSGDPLLEHRVAAWSLTPAGVLSGPLDVVEVGGVGSEQTVPMAPAALADGTVVVNVLRRHTPSAQDRCELRFIRPGSMPPADAGVLDAGAADVPGDVATGADTGADVGPRPDAGPADAGAVDASVAADVTAADASAMADAGAGTDASAMADVGAVPPADDGGCSVSGAPHAKGSPTALGALGLALGATVARRRRRR